MTHLLTSQELAQSRESDTFYRMFDEQSMHARRLILDQRGLSPVYECDVIVGAAMQSYLLGRSTWEGSLLLAYRALVAKWTQLLKQLETNGATVLWTSSPPKRTLGSVTVEDVMHMSVVCHDLNIEDEKTKRMQVLDQLAEQSQELGMGY